MAMTSCRNGLDMIDGSRSVFAINKVVDKDKSSNCCKNDVEGKVSGVQKRRC